MTEPTEKNQFIEWVEQFANDTITPDDAEKLLELVQRDPEKLDALCAQLQTDRLLEITHQPDPRSLIAEVVLERAKGLSSSSDLKKVRRSKTFLKIVVAAAASVVIFLGLFGLMGDSIQKKLGGGVDALQGDDSYREDSRSYLTDLGDDGASMQDEMTVTSANIVGYAKRESEELVPLEITFPKPLFAGTPKKVVSDNLETAPAATQRSDLMAHAIDSYNSGQLENAEQVFTAVLAEDPYNRDAMEYLKRTAQKQASNEARMQRSSRATALSSVDSAWNPAPLISPSRENYAAIVENEFGHTKDKTLSTFSIDVDTASYANIRRYLTRGSLPPQDAVRIEEMINYFDYDYEGPDGADPFATSMALTSCPWNPDHQLLRVGLQGRKLAEDDRKNSNLVFLMDVSGSMSSSDKLPLLKTGFAKMVRALGEKDRVAIVVYAGSSGVVLDSTSAMDKETIIGAMNRLSAGGSTAGGQGIELAYKLATDHFIKGGVNRVILATDGDFNVGISNIDSLQKLIEEKRKSNVFLSVLGFGTGNLQDAKMEMLANKGNGNYFYIDSKREAEKVLVKQLTANMVTIAKDVKIQVEFNPALVRSYRLIGYENRMLAARDFADDTKDAGEIGAGHQVTALYELVPADAPAAEDGVPLKYTKPAEPAANHENTSELLTLKLRYKQPEGSKSKLLTFTLNKEAYRPEAMDASFRWAMATAAFGMHLRASNRIGSFTMNEVIELAKSAMERDPHGYRAECVELMNKALNLKSNAPSANEYPQWQYR